VNYTTFDILDIPYVVDGDTLWIVRRCIIGQVDSGKIIYEDNSGGVSCRLYDGLNGLNTPEKHGPKGDLIQWSKARQDLSDWVANQQLVNLELRVYKKDSFGRLLSNICYKTGPETAVNVMINKGWKPYK
jgi:endonuclease YncB( thermonuclease family)